MLSDNLPWWPSVSRNKLDGYTRVSRDIWNSSTDDVDADTTISFSAPSETIVVTHVNFPVTGRALIPFVIFEQLASDRVTVIGRRLSLKANPMTW